MEPGKKKEIKKDFLLEKSTWLLNNNLLFWLLNMVLTVSVWPINVCMQPLLKPRMSQSLIKPSFPQLNKVCLLDARLYTGPMWPLK